MCLHLVQINTKYELESLMPCAYYPEIQKNDGNKKPGPGMYVPTLG